MSEATVLADVAARYWDAFAERTPTVATAFGDHRFDDRMDDLRPEATAAHRSRLAGLLDEARAIDGDAASLTEQDRVSAAALVAQIEMDLDVIHADIDDWSVDPIEGPQVTIFNIESFQPVSTPDEGRALLARWEAMPAMLDQHAANLRESLGDGRVAVRAPVARSIEALDDLLAQPVDAWPLLAPAAVDHPEWPAPDLLRYRESLREVVGGEIRPALARLRDVLGTHILPAARSDESPGIAGLPGGADAYRRLVRVETSLDHSPEAIHQIGLDEVARINDELSRLGERALGTADRAEILRRLRSDSSLYFTTEDEVANKATSALERAAAAIPEWFGVQPRAACVVERMGEHEAKHGTIAYYRQPDPAGGRPGRYYVNTTEPSTRPRYEAEALAYHESIPGHHLQIAIAQEVEGLPAFRRHLGVTAFWEGWGLYAERLSNEMGLYSGDLDRIGMLSLDAWRACRLVVDTGMHAFGWSRQAAVDFMTANTALAPNNIANEVDRYIAWPGQALAYKAGQLALLQLRADLRENLGAGFDIRAFHDAVLSGGALGLGTVRETVERRMGVADR